jgi:hypothetical protein
LSGPGREKPIFILWLRSQTLLVSVVAGISVSLLLSVAVPETLVLPLRMIIAMLEAMALGSVVGMFLGMVSGMIEGTIVGMAVSMAVMLAGPLGLRTLTVKIAFGSLAGIVFSVPLLYFHMSVKSGEHRGGKG